MLSQSKLALTSFSEVTPVYIHVHGNDLIMNRQKPPRVERDGRRRVAGRDGVPLASREVSHDCQGLATEEEISQQAFFLDHHLMMLSNGSSPQSTYLLHREALREGGGTLEGALDYIERIQESRASRHLPFERRYVYVYVCTYILLIFSDVHEITEQNPRRNPVRPSLQRFIRHDILLAGEEHP